MATNLAIDANSPYEQLIAATIAIERAPQATLKTQQTVQKQQKSILNGIDSTLSALRTALKALTDPVASALGGRAATVPSGAAYQATATDDAALGSHTLDVRRLAAADSRASARTTNAGTDLRTWFDGQGGTQTFTVQVANPTEDDPDARVDVAVTVAPTGTNDGEIMAQIGTALNAALDAAVDDGRLAKTSRPTTSLVHETTDTSRLTLTSAKTGFGQRLTFLDSAGGLLDRLELTRDGVLAEGDAHGGMRTAVGTSAETSSLSSKFVLNGLMLYRDANAVEDALTGVSLSLTSTGGPTTFTVGVDKDGARGQVTRFIEKYNASIELLRKNTLVDSTAKTRGALADDSAFRGLRSAFRTSIAEAAKDVDGGLGAFGITVAADGTLSLATPSTFDKALAEDPEGVQAFFGNGGSLSKALDDTLDRYLGTSGVIRSRTDSIDQRLKTVDKRVSDWDERLSRREDALRQQYAKMQETLMMLQSQSNAFVSYYNSSLQY